MKNVRKPTGVHLRFCMACCLALLTAPCSCGQEKRSDESWTNLRQQMVDQQLKSRGRGIREPAVLEAMSLVPRHEFVPEKIRHLAYEDTPLPIGHGQTISQPYIVAFMTEKLGLKATDRVLEIGTGSGYQAAVLSHLVKEVFTIEIVEPLGLEAKSTLERLGFKNVKVRVGDGYLGWPEAAPFDAIIVTCAPENVPRPLVEQLAEGGRMIIPVGREGGEQNLHLLNKKNGGIHQTAILPVRFVPMTGKAKAPGS